MLTHLLFPLALIVGQTHNPCCDACYEELPPVGMEEESEHWLLMQSLQCTHLGHLLNCNRIQAYGWTEGSFTASSAAGSQLPMGFNDRANEFLLHQNWLRIERTVDMSASTPSFGFLADTIFPGADYRFTVARGLADRQGRTYGFDPVQFYAQAYFPDVAQGLDVKFGRFFGQYGVESTAAIDTPFVSRAYTFIYNPFTHTGLFSSLQLTDNWSAQNGLVTGSDVFIDPAASPTYIGGVTWAPPNGASSLQFAVILGSGRYNQIEAFDNPQVFNLVYTHQLNDSLAYTLDALFGFQTNVPDIGTATWFGTVNYLTYQINPRVSGTTRIEFFADVDGNRTGYQGLYTALTAGLNIQPRRDVIFRPEIRYDYNNESRPFDNRRGLSTVAADVIVRW